MRGFYEENMDDAMRQVKEQGVHGKILQSKDRPWWVRSLSKSEHRGAPSLGLVLGLLVALVVGILAWVLMRS